MTLWMTLWLLICGHALADFALQSEAMAIGKNRNSTKFRVLPWGYWLTSHALIHGLAVTLVLGPIFGVAEFVAHWLIDFGKCESWYGIHYDQMLHLGCKCLWFVLWLGVTK